MTLEEKVDKLRVFLFDTLKLSISEYIHYHNPEHLAEWQYNCCNQTSVLTNLILKEILVDGSAGYTEIQSWQGWFRDYVREKVVEYNHCWIYCIHGTDPEKNLFVDIARNHKELLCFFTPKNKYPKEHKDYQYMLELKRERINIKGCIREPEYFTSKPTTTIIKELKRYMAKQVLLKQPAQAPAAIAA